MPDFLAILFLFAQSGGDLIVVENTEHEAVNGEQEEVAVDDVEDDEGDLDVVQPSEQWQTLKPGNTLSFSFTGLFPGF